MVRGAGTTDVCGIQRPDFPEGSESLSIAARLAAAAQCDGCAIFTAPPLGRLGRAWPSFVSDARRTERQGCTRDRAGALRRELAAARLRRRMGGNVARERREGLAAQARQLRLHR